MAGANSENAEIDELSVQARYAIRKYMAGVVLPGGIIATAVAAAIGWFVNDLAKAQATAEALQKIQQPLIQANLAVGDALSKAKALEEIANASKEKFDALEQKVRKFEQDAEIEKIAPAVTSLLMKDHQELLIERVRAQLSPSLSQNVAEALVRDHKDELPRGEEGTPGISPSAEDVAAALVRNHRNELPKGADGTPGTSPTAAEVAAALIRNHKQELPKGDDGQPGSDAQFPPNAVVAFALQTPTGVALDGEHDDPCPSGWERYKQANGRFILGVGKGPLNTRPEAFSLEGTETHTLSIEEMPKHQHTTITQVDEQWATWDRDEELGNIKGSAGSAGVSTFPGALTRSAGRGDPHNNMPPYIALYFCNKVPG